MDHSIRHDQHACPATSLTPLKTALLRLCHGLQPLSRCVACATDLTAPEAANDIRGYPPDLAPLLFPALCRFLDSSIFTLPDSRLFRSQPPAAVIRI
jgi:hypothetical protein